MHKSVFEWSAGRSEEKFTSNYQQINKKLNFQPTYELSPQGYYIDYCTSPGLDRWQIVPCRKSTLCTLMLLSNPAYPEWVSFPCNVERLLDVVCIKNKTEEISLKSNMSALLRCKASSILQNGKCYSFIFYDGKGILFKTIKNITNAMKIKSANTFQFIFKAIEVQFPNLLILHSNNMILIKQFSHDRYFSIQLYSRQ